MSFHCTMFILVHLDALNVVARVLCIVSFIFLTDYGHLSFFPCLMCASYELEPYMCFGLCHAIFTGVYAMYFVINVVTRTSMQSSSRDVADFRDLEFF